MIKFIVSTLLIALLSFICGLFLPWWTIALAAFGVSVLIPQQPLPSFLSGFLALTLLWGLLALGIDTANNSILSARIATMLFLGGSSVALICLTAFIAGLVGGGAAITGAFLKKPRLQQPG
jgi:hypothetical protein